MGVSTHPSYRFRSASDEALPEAALSADIALLGDAVDDRGAATTQAIKAKVSTVHSVRFEIADHSLHIDGNETRFAQLKGLLPANKRVLIDGTTLGFGEILQIMQAAKSAGRRTIEFLYAEPKLYSRRMSANGHAQSVEYHLTTNCEFTTVQGFAQEYSTNRLTAHVFMLGFEPARLLSAIEQRQFDMKTERLHAIIGVPAFHPGWEANSIRPHLEALTDISIGERNISYCQANSVREAYLTLWNLYRQLGDESGCFYVSPLGTKPHAMAAALFLVETKGADANTSLYYDHPVRVKSRSAEVGQWHHIEMVLA